MRCPYCAEEIQDQALVCRFCHRDLIFYRPMAERMQALEGKLAELAGRVDAVEAASREFAHASQPATPGAPLSYYAAPLLLDAVLSAGLYAYYRSTNVDALLLLSILMPFLAGLWIGVIPRPARDLRNYLVAGLCAGLLNSAAVVLVLTFTLPSTLRVNWGDVMSLYFLPSFLLIIGGGLVGDRARSRLIGHEPPPAYASHLASAIVRTAPGDQPASAELVDKLAKWIAALTPLLGVIASIVSAVLVYLKR